MSVETLRKNLDTAIDATGLTKSAFAKANPEVGRSTLTKFLSGASSTIALEHIEYYAAALDTSVGALLGETPDASAIDGVELVPHRKIDRSDLNPRKTFDEESLAELAASIKERGLLEPIGLYKNNKRYLLAYGERRWRAIGLLIEAGDWPKSRGILATVSDMPDEAAMIIDAVTENLQREGIDPIEEANAFLRLRDKADMKTKDIASLVGKGQRYVQKRLTLVEKLGGAAQKALKDGELSLDAAQAVARVPEKDQMDLVDACKRNGWSDAENVMIEAKRGKTCVSEAIFDLKLYDGAFIGEGSTRCFDDMDQFLKLQQAAATAKKDQLEKTWAWASVIKATYWGAWHHDKSEDRNVAGVVLHFHPHTGVVKTFENLLPEAEDDDSDETTQEETEEEKTAREAREWKEAQQGAVKLATRKALTANPRIALVNHLFSSIGGEVLGRYICGEGEKDTEFMVIGRLGLALPRDDNDEPIEYFEEHDEFMLKLYRTLCGLTVDELLQLLALATAAEFNWPVWVKPDAIDLEMWKELKIEIPDGLLPKTEPEDQEAA